MIWRKATDSHTNGCVEVGIVDDRVCVRDSKDRTGPTLVFTLAEWQAFLAGVRAGEFDGPVAEGART